VVSDSRQAPPVWDEVRDRAKAMPGVEEVAFAGWPLLTHRAWNNGISVNGVPPTAELAYFLKFRAGGQTR
jgi:putative ABC transport system permease protein